MEVEIGDIRLVVIELTKETLDDQERAQAIVVVEVVVVKACIESASIVVDHRLQKINEDRMSIYLYLIIL